MKFITQATLTTVAFVGLMVAGIELATAGETLSLEQQLKRGFEDAKQRQDSLARFTVYTNKTINRAKLSRELRKVMPGVSVSCKGLNLSCTANKMTFNFNFKYPKRVNYSQHRWTIDIKPCKKSEGENRKH